MKKVPIIFFTLFLALPTFLSSAVQLSGVGLRIGQVRPSVTNESAMSIGLHCDINTEETELIFRPFFDYWAASYEKGKDEWDRQLFAVGVSALKPFNLNNSKAVPFVGGGLGFTFNSWQTKLPQDSEKPSQKNHDFDLALNVVGGIQVPVTPSLNGLLELKYTLAGMVDYFGFWIGVSYQL